MGLERLTTADVWKQGYPRKMEWVPADEAEAALREAREEIERLTVERDDRAAVAGRHSMSTELLARAQKAESAKREAEAKLDDAVETLWEAEAKLDDAVETLWEAEAKLDDAVETLWWIVYEAKDRGSEFRAAMSAIRRAGYDFSADRSPTGLRGPAQEDQ